MLNSIQNRLLEMLKWFDDYCLSHDLTYYVVGGTLLGAIRHQGFIPWDDDIDVALPRDDYNRLINDFENDDRYCLETPYCGNKDFLYSYSKLYDKSTTLVEKSRKKCVRGLYIDVFPLDGIGDSKEEIKKNYRRFDIKNMLLMTRVLEINRNDRFIKKFVIRVVRLVPERVLNTKKLSIKVDKIAQKVSYDKSIYVGNLMGAYRYKELFNKKYIGKVNRYKFESIEVNGFQYYDKYLTHIYGDWRKIPPEDKRHGAHEYLEYDLNASYLTKGGE